MSCLAIDIGGANLKAADGCGYAATRPFAVLLAEDVGVFEDNDEPAA